MKQDDISQMKVQETVTVRKFKVDEWTEEQISTGEAEPFEILTIEDGVVVKKWVRDGTD